MLKGDKVILRPMRREYLEKYFEYRNDVELELLSSGEPPMPMEYERLVATFEAHLQRPRSEVAWFAIEVQGGKFIGQCLLHNFDYAARTCELGLTIGDRDYLGHGYGRDVVKLLVKYAFRLRNMEKVWLTTNGSNIRAQKAFAAAGFVEEGRLRRHIWLDGRYDDLVYMGILREPPAETVAGDAGEEPEPALESADAEDEA
ncbi:MAG TPA: GNAT family protein [Tepidiformaceae bacterium]|jgi:RimJ/RimL family protein N-acetyltransferase|nr:GNAT family protein [Tepidiformaceae bacterium]